MYSFEKPLYTFVSTLYQLKKYFISPSRTRVYKFYFFSFLLICYVFFSLPSLFLSSLYALSSLCALSSLWVFYWSAKWRGFLLKHKTAWVCRLETWWLPAWWLIRWLGLRGVGWPEGGGAVPISTWRHGSQPGGGGVVPISAWRHGSRPGGGGAVPDLGFFFFSF